MGPYKEGNMVRCGQGLYSLPGLLPAMTITSMIIQLKHVEGGYDQTYKTKGKYVAIVPVG
jgi:alanine racemase